MSQSPLTVALHEAGHAWASHAMGADVLELTIIPSDDANGYCLHNRVKGDRPWYEHAVITLAGMAAECVVAGDDDIQSRANNGGYEDMQIAGRITGSKMYRSLTSIRMTPSARFVRAWESALILAREHFTNIDRLARFLLRHPKMGECCMPAIRHIEAGKDMTEWRYCAYCGLKLPESEVAA